MQPRPNPGFIPTTKGLAKFGLSLKATYTHRLGSNPDPTSTGDDQDGSHIDNRVWLQASIPF